MKVRNLAILAAVGGFVLAGSAQAGITGLSVTQADFSAGWTHADGSVGGATAVVDATTAGAWGAFSATHTVYRVWATVSSPLDTVAFAGGSVDTANNELSLNSTSGLFFNSFVGGNLPGSPFGAFGDANAAFDSYVTLGGAYDAENTASIVDPTNILGGLAGNVFGGNVGWNNIPTPGQGVVSDGAGGWRVLLAQLTVGTGEVVFGNIRVAGGPDDLYLAFAVPTPGALALLGLAGLAGTRRRRA